MARSKTATKPTISAAVIRSRTELDTAVGRIGELQTQKQRIEADYNEKIAQLQGQLAEAIEPMDKEIQSLSAGIKTFCDANRSELIPSDKKSTDLVTGQIAYRAKQPKVTTRSTEKLIEKILEEAGLIKFRDQALKKFHHVLLRMKLELDKDAVLDQPGKAEELGIEIEEPVERFYIKPSVTGSEIEAAA